MRRPEPLVVLSLIMTAFANICYAQTWKALNPPLNLFNGTIYTTTVDYSGNLYAGGDFKNSNDNYFVAKWNGTSWNELGDGASGLHANGTILTLASRGDTVFAAGGFVNQYYQGYVAKWNGSSWSELDKGNSLHANGLIYSIAVDKLGNVYAAGGFTNAAGKYYVAKWNGSTWSELGTGSDALNADDPIFAIAADASGNVYAGGYFTDASGKEYVSKWDGHTWSALGSGPTALNANDFIRCLATDESGNVYAGGNFRKSNNEYYLAKWNGTTWTETGIGANALHANDAISSIAVKNKSEIYVAGYFTDGGNHYVAKWNGVSWSQINNAQSPLLAKEPIQSISVDANDHIYAGGKFLNKSGHAFVAEWNGTGWNEMGSKGDPFYTAGPIFQIVADSAGSNVYVSEYSYDNGESYHIMHWNGSGWQQLQIPDTSNLFIFLQSTAGFGQSRNMVVDKQGNLYVTGRRAISVDSGYDCILKWDGAKWSILEDFPNSLKTYNDNPAYGIHEIEMDSHGNIYAASNFNDPVYGLCSMAKWDGKTWSRLPGSYGDYIERFCVASDGNIYAYGAFTNEYGRAVVANYNPAKEFKWVEVKNGTSEFSVPGFNELLDMDVDSRNNLYVNGGMNDSTGDHYLAKWDGTSWSEFGATSGSFGWLFTIDKNDNFYATGIETYAGDCIVKRWNGTSWTGIGVPVSLDKVFPLGKVITTDAAGNVYSDALLDVTGSPSYVAKYDATASQAPVLFSFTPATGSVGTSVSIKGKNLTGTASVSFGGTKAASFTVLNDSTITAVVANGSTGSVQVTTSGGSDSLKTFTYTCDSVKGPVPQISLLQDSILVSSSANYYQWYFNNHSLQKEHSYLLVINDAGFYRVETSSDKVCWVSSLDYPVLISRNNLSDSLKLNIYPNPSSGRFTIDVKLPQTTTVKTYVQVFDVNGVQVLQTGKLIFYGDEIKIPVTINNKGTYFVKIFVNDDAIQQSIIIM